MSVFSRDMLKRAMEPNLSPVVERRIGTDPAFPDNWIVVTRHEDGSFTIVEEHIADPAGYSGARVRVKR